MREFLAELRVGLPVTKLAKGKTTVQMIALGFLAITFGLVFGVVFAFIKLLLPRGLKPEEEFASIVSEARAMARVRHAASTSVGATKADGIVRGPWWAW